MINAINTGDHRSFSHCSSRWHGRDAKNQVPKWVLPSNMLAMHSDNPQEAGAKLRLDINPALVTHPPPPPPPMLSRCVPQQTVQTLM